MGVVVKKLKVQFCQLATAINSQWHWKFPSDTEVNPVEHHNTITLRSKKVVEESKPIKAMVPSPNHKHIEKQLFKEHKVEVETTKKNYKPNSMDYKFNIITR